jgi:hypothetical protein
MALWLRPRAATRAQTLILCATSVLLSSAPDLDYLPGLATGSLNAFHQGPTHSLAAVTLAALAVAAIPPLRRVCGTRSAFRFFLFAWSLMLVHLLLDVFTADFRPPIGIPLFWPFTSAPVHGTPAIFPAWSKMALSDLFTAPNLRPVLVESLTSLALLLPTFLLTRRRRPAT